MPDESDRQEPSEQALTIAGCLMGFAAFVAAWIIMTIRGPVGPH